jgi:hypothetical protein
LSARRVKLDVAYRRPLKNARLSGKHRRTGTKIKSLHATDAFIRDENQMLLRPLHNYLPGIYAIGGHAGGEQGEEKGQ